MHNRVPAAGEWRDLGVDNLQVMHVTSRQNFESAVAGVKLHHQLRFPPSIAPLRTTGVHARHEPPGASNRSAVQVTIKGCTYDVSEIWLLLGVGLK
jgi:hypothetical protein